MWSRIKKVSLSVQILVGLALGAIVGLALPSDGQNAAVDGVVEGIAIAGKLWLQALQMTILPLVFGLLSTLFIRSHGVSRGSGTARRAFIVIIALYVLGIVLGIVNSYVLLGAFPVTDSMAQALRSLAGAGVAAETLPWQEAVLSVVPTNIASAMAGNSLLPVLFFALVFGAALAAAKDSEGKRALAAGLTGLTEVAFVIVDWVLRLAPIGVALLILPTTQRFGTDIFAGLAHWVSLSVTNVLVHIAVIYLVVVLLTKVPVLRFAKEIVPAQSVAFGTQSSTGTMPVTIECCRRMGMSEEAVGATMPLSAVLFRMVAPASYIFTTVYCLMVFDMDPLPLAMLFGLGLLGIAVEMGSVGIPGAATYVATYAPFAAIAGFPIEIIIVLLVVETLPDMFKTLFHVTAHATATGIVDRGIEPEPATPA